MKTRKKVLLYLALVLAFIPVPLLLTTDIKLAIVWLVFVALSTAYCLYRRNIGEELLVALFFALFVTSYKASIYTNSNLLLGHINIYPLVLWTAGLVALREIYEHLHMSYRWVVASSIYLVALIGMEYLGYYVFGIQIALDSPSLFGLGIIHGTLFIHWFYPSAGPLYLLATDYLRVK